MGSPLRRAVVFDLDGTLVDSSEDIANALNHTLRALGRDPVAVDSVPRMIGHGVRFLLGRALGDETAVEAARGIFYDAYLRCCTERTRPYPGMLTLLDALRAHGVRLGVATNKPRDFTARVLESTGVGLLLSGWASADEVESRKPDPGVLALAAQRIDPTLEPSQILYVGDHVVDLETAQRFGCVAVGVLWGFGADALEARRGSTELAASVEDLQKLLLSGKN